MSVYVDRLMRHVSNNAPRCFRSKPSCHLYADSHDELDIFASRIGMKREWCQKRVLVQHYDLTEARRKRAVELGAIEQTFQRSSTEVGRTTRAGQGGEVTFFGQPEARRASKRAQDPVARKHWEDGVRHAAKFAGTWDRSISGTPYRFEDIILCKFNLKKRLRRKRP